jgi:hypothetical protein
VNWERYVLLGLGVVVALAAMTPHAARLKPVQAGGIGAALLIMLVALLPGTKISLFGNSIEPAVAAKKDEVNASAAATEALARRVDTLEVKFQTFTSAKATEEQKREALAADAQAKQHYEKAAAAAAAARRRYLQSLNPFVVVPDPATTSCKALTDAKGNPITAEDGRYLCAG